MSDICTVCLGGTVECVCDLNRAANDNTRFDPRFIRLPPDEVLLRPSTVRRLAIAYAALGLPRRSVLNLVADQVYGYDDEGVIVDARGMRVDPAEIEVDDVFRTEDDPSERWISSFLRFAIAAPQRTAQSRIAPRLRLLWLALAISKRAQAEFAIR